MRQKVMKVGHSLAVTIPSEFCREVGIKNGDEIKVVTVPEKGKISYYFTGSQQLMLLGDLFSKQIK